MTPTVGHWYLNVLLPMRRTQRLRVVSVNGDQVTLAYLVEAGAPTCELVWRLDAFRACFRPCEDLSVAQVCAPCPSDCVCCFSPRVVRVVDRIVRRADAARAKRREHRRVERMRHTQIPQLTPAAPVRKAR